MNKDNKILKENDILALYDYLYEYEHNIKKKKGSLNVYDKIITDFKVEHNLFFGSINNEKDKKKAQKFDNYFLWSEGAVKNKKAKVDRAHALLRRIRNAFAHGNLYDNQDGYFKIKDIDEKGITLDGVISYPLLYQLVEKLEQTNNKM